MSSFREPVSAIEESWIQETEQNQRTNPCSYCYDCCYWRRVCSAPAAAVLHECRGTRPETEKTRGSQFCILFRASNIPAVVLLPSSPRVV